MGDKVQQIIQHRKGCIDKVKDINSYISEIIYGTGDVGDLRGNVVFIGNQNSGSGNYSPISKIYQGTNAPTVNGYGKTLNGIPFYSVYDKTLYILNNPKNIDMDLSGNIYRRNIAPNNISASGFISGNSLNITGDVKLGKNDTNIIEINGKIKGSLIPLTSNTYDLGTPTNKWRNIFATNISGAFSGDGSNLKNINTSMSVELIGISTNVYNISLPNEKLTFYTDPTKGLNLIMGSKRVELTAYDATYTQKGTSYYNSDDFIVSTGYVSTNYTKLNSLSSSFNNFTSSIQNWTSSFESYTSSIGNYSKTINTSLNQILVGSSSYSNTLDVNVLSNSIINFKLSDDLVISSSIVTNTLYTSGSAYVGGAMQLMGNLYVSGSVTVIDSINVNIGDNIIGLNAAGNLTDGGIHVYDYVGGLTTGSLLWDVTNNWWKAGEVGSEKRIVFQENNTNLTTNALTFANSNGRLISANAPITNDIPLWNGTTWTNINSSQFATTGSLGDFTSSFNTWTGSVFLNFSSSVNTQFINVNSVLNNFSSYTASLNIATGSFFKQGGNSFGATAILGTNDNNSLSFETNNSNRLTISSLGNVDVIRSVNIGENLTINGETSILSTLYDGTLSAGSSNQFLRSNSVSGVQWTTIQMSHISQLHNYTSSVSSSLNSLNNYTSSFQTTYNNFSSSVNTQFINVNNVLSSLNSYTSSNNTILNNFSVYTASLNASTGSFFKQGGNSFGATAILGTNDNNSLIFETNNTTRVIVSSLGEMTAFNNFEAKQNLLIRGSTFIFSALYDSNIYEGNSNEFLRSTSTNGVVWTQIEMSHINNLLNYTSSVSSSLNSLNNYTSSNNTFINNFSSSVNTQFININSTTGSFFKQGGNSFGISGSLGTNDNFPLFFKTNNINRIVLGTDGKFTIGTIGVLNGLLNVGGDIVATGDISAYNASDIRLKKNIKKIENASNLLSKLNGYTFDWNDKQSLYENGTHDMGVIAQEVEKLFPQIVGERYDGYKSVKYDRLIPLLIESVNELRNEFEYLKTKL